MVAKSADRSATAPRSPVHLSVGEMRIGAERHFTGIPHDLSARTVLEERLRNRFKYQLRQGAQST